MPAAAQGAAPAATRGPLQAMAQAWGTGSRALSFLLGSVVLGLAGASLLGAPGPGQIVDWALGVLGWIYLLLLGGLAFTAVACWLQVLRPELPRQRRQTWHEAGQHAAGGIATVALTYTLFGISLGVGELAGQELTPDTVQGVIRGLTERFSLAFMTTVVGLPASALLRALLAVGFAWRDGAATDRAAGHRAATGGS